MSNYTSKRHCKRKSKPQLNNLHLARVALAAGVNHAPGKENRHVYCRSLEIKALKLLKKHAENKLRNELRKNSRACNRIQKLETTHHQLKKTVSLLERKVRFWNTEVEKIKASTEHAIRGYDGQILELQANLRVQRAEKYALQKQNKRLVQRMLQAVKKTQKKCQKEGSIYRITHKGKYTAQVKALALAASAGRMREDGLYESDCDME